MAEINVVPYIDVMLVLLVIFMVTAPLLTEGVAVDLPQASANPVESETEPVVLTVDRDGNYFLGEDAKSPEEIRAYAAAVLRRNPQVRFMVRGDKAVPYEAVVSGMVYLQQGGVKAVSLITDAEGA